MKFRVDSSHSCMMVKYIKLTWIMFLKRSSERIDKTEIIAHSCHSITYISTFMITPYIIYFWVVCVVAKIRLVCGTW